MTITSPKKDKITREIFRIMNSTDNSVQHQYDKMLKIKNFFNKSLKEEKIFVNVLMNKFESAIELYAETHIETFGFFNFEPTFFLSMINER